MAARPGKKEKAEESARDIAARLERLRLPDHIDSPRKWTIAAGVSSSFFTNLRGGESKPPSEPSVSNLRAVLEAAGSSLPEFFLHEAQGRLVPVPSKQDVEAALHDALAATDLPKRRERRAVYLAEVVGQLLGLPRRRSATRATTRSGGKASPSTIAPPRRATRRA